MSIHIAAKQGEIADKILLPGDPLRAKFIAENFLEDAVCFNEVRNMFGYTGTYKGHRVSVMGTGMGMPSISIVRCPISLATPWAPVQGLPSMTMPPPTPVPSVRNTLE